MSELSDLLLPLAMGLALGALFFGGLWWTVQRGAQSRQPMLWFIASLIVRTVVVVAGFGLIADGRWQRLAICLLGFVVARIATVRLLGRARPPGRPAVPDA